MAEKEKMQREMIYDANNDRNLLDERAMTEGLCCQLNNAVHYL